MIERKLNIIFCKQQLKIFKVIAITIIQNANKAELRQKTCLKTKDAYRFYMLIKYNIRACIMCACINQTYNFRNIISITFIFLNR